MKLRPISNPPHRWSTERIEWDDDTPPPLAGLEIFEEDAVSILSENTSPDIGFKYSLNPYRGCQHACSYCYARPTHGYWDFGAGTDFERKIVVKVNAPEKLRERFMKRSWKGELVVFSGNTDCYQPLEADYELTRRCLLVCLEFRNPVGLITKGTLIRRDIDILKDLHREARVTAHISISFDDDEMARKIEPGAPSSTARFRTIRMLADAGIPVGVSMSPIIPGLNDSQIAGVLERARDSGATTAFRVLLRLPAEVKTIFSERLREEYPDRANKVLNGVRAARKGKLYDSTFGDRMTGDGPRWEAVEWLFRKTCDRLGLNARTYEADTPTTFHRPEKQIRLFQ